MWLKRAAAAIGSTPSRGKAAKEEEGRNAKAKDGSSSPRSSGSQSRAPSPPVLFRGSLPVHSSVLGLLIQPGLDRDDGTAACRRLMPRGSYIHFMDGCRARTTRGRAHDPDCVAVGALEPGVTQGVGLLAIAAGPWPRPAHGSRSRGPSPVHSSVLSLLVLPGLDRDDGAAACRRLMPRGSRVHFMNGCRARTTRRRAHGPDCVAVGAVEPGVTQGVGIRAIAAGPRPRPSSCPATAARPRSSRGCSSRRRSQCWASFASRRIARPPCAAIAVWICRSSSSCCCSSQQTAAAQGEQGGGGGHRAAGWRGCRTLVH